MSYSKVDRRKLGRHKGEVSCWKTAMSSAGERSAKVAFQLGFAIVILVSSVIGNGFSGALLVRFKQLRTVQNILMANVALVHVINAIFNIPSFVTLYTKLGSPVVGPLYNLYYHLNLFSMLCMAIDRYAAIVYGIRYLTWKTTKKACLSVLLAWLLGIACSIISCATGDLKEAQDWTLLDFQRARFQSDAGLSLAAITVSMPLLMIAALTALTCYTSHKARRTVCQLITFDKYEIWTLWLVVVAYVTFFNREDYPDTNTFKLNWEKLNPMIIQFLILQLSCFVLPCDDCD